MKKMYAFIFLFLGMSSFCLAEEEVMAECENDELVAQAPSNGTATQPGCAGLPADQQNFAMQLMKPENKNMFCNKFNMDQRKSAMQMMGTPGQNGMTMSADQSVESVAQKNNMMMTPSGGTGTSQMQRRGQGCPVRGQ